MGRVLPILFNTDMVRAILGGKKTVTRRVIKKSQCTLLNKKETSELEREGLYAPFDGMNDAELIVSTYKPTYQKGDILYVRETWCSGYDGEVYFYLADKNTEREQKQLKDYNVCRWRPSIHMPKQAARIWLKVTDVRVERLQDITEKQAIKEGAVEVKYDANTGKEMSAALDWFPVIWNSTIKKSDVALYGWEANPWVWVIEFERCEKPESEG